MIQDLDKEMYSLEIGQLVIIRIDADAEEQARVSPVHHLGAALKLDEVGLVFLISRGDETVYLSTLSVIWMARYA